MHSEFAAATSVRAKSQFFVRLLRSKAALASAIVFLLVVLAAVTAAWIAPNDPYGIRLVQRLKPPGYVNASGVTFWLGTDTLGPDVLTGTQVESPPPVTEALLPAWG